METAKSVLNCKNAFYYMLAVLGAFVLYCGSVLAGYTTLFHGLKHNDSMMYYIVGEIAGIDPMKAYSFDELWTRTSQYVGKPVYYANGYPPPIILLCSVLPTLCIRLAYIVFIAASLGSFLLTTRLLATSFEDFFIAFAAILPSIYFNIYAGRNGFVTAALVALFCLAYLKFESKDLADLPLGLLLLRPHLPPALLAFAFFNRIWGVLFRALALVVVIVAITTVYLNFDIWVLYAVSAQSMTRLLMNYGPNYIKLASEYGFARSFGLDNILAMELQIFTAFYFLLQIYLHQLNEFPVRSSLGFAVLLTFGMSLYSFPYDMCLGTISAGLLLPTIQTAASRAEKVWLALLSWTAGLFNVLYKPRYKSVTAGSMAPLHRAWAIILTQFAPAMLRACERRRAMTPGLTRMRLASSARVTSWTQWFWFSTAQ
jgi:hypothetical protein